MSKQNDGFTLGDVLVFVLVLLLVWLFQGEPSVADALRLKVLAWAGIDGGGA